MLTRLTAVGTERSSSTLSARTTVAPWTSGTKISKTERSKLIDVEEVLIQLRSTGTGQDGVRYPAKVAGKLRHLANGVSSADFRPTDQHGEVQVLLRSVLMNARADLDALLETDLAALNQLLRDRGLNPLISD